MQRLVIIDCGSGNLHSVQAGLVRAAANSNCGIVVTTQAKDVVSADRIVLPGVGAFADCMKGLEAMPEMREALEQRVLRDAMPFLGICVGMQMMMERGLEHGEHAGLGWLPGEVVPIEPKDATLKIPHMGWNELRLDAPSHPLFSGLAGGMHMYFVHSYHARCANGAHRLAHVEYGENLTATVGRDNMAGTQFHPEKSHRAGEKLLSNFIAWAP